MLLRLLLLFTLVPLVELALLIWVAEKAGLGPWWTLCLVVLTGALGAALARHEGLRCLGRIRQKVAAGELPGDPLLDGLMILLAGALLITPGMLTDLLGFALLLPPFRRIVKRRLVRHFQSRIQVFPPTGRWPPPSDQPPTHDRIIDARIVDAPPKHPDQRD
jgi:UPF0716 protein FxsA